MKAVRPYTIKGKILCAILIFLCGCIRVFKGRAWSRAIEFEENPRTMTFGELVYFTYKYYYRPPVLPSHPSVKAHFSRKTETDEVFDTMLSISIGGDLMPYEMIKPEHTEHLWDDIGADFFGSDIVFANLETPVDSSSKPGFVPEVMLNHMHFNTNEASYDIFSGFGKHKGYDVLSVANNHSLDMGKDGLSRTIEFLKARGVRTVGAKTRQTDADYEIMEINGIKIGFVAYTYSLNEYLPETGGEWMLNYLPLNCAGCDIELIKQHVRQCREAGADLVVCSMHCGNAYQAYPSQQTIDLFQAVFNSCGVDVIAGGHPHNLQPWQTYTFTDPFSGKQKKGFAIYSLADFIAYDIFTWCHLCAYVKLEVGRNTHGEVVFRPIVRPMVMQREQGQLKLVYAEKVLVGKALSPELQDIKLLYDICVR